MQHVHQPEHAPTLTGYRGRVSHGPSPRFASVHTDDEWGVMTELGLVHDGTLLQRSASSLSCGVTAIQRASSRAARPTTGLHQVRRAATGRPGVEQATSCPYRARGRRGTETWRRFASPWRAECRA